jgi:hypothetical protein
MNMHKYLRRGVSRNVSMKVNTEIPLRLDVAAVRVAQGQVARLPFVREKAEKDAQVLRALAIGTEPTLSSRS